ncbi:hypothetical protein [Micromonospora sp. WMMD987]|jgi:hypothetical protein|uniref:hypothetical protein n=1 Tax=Micromonospora TaxID=1873 RepID=UPI00249BB9BC|nr:hypothetical protein [Micromonospora sp. WMMD987]WFE93141.1 hypothetical protein O7612_17130 [Micromonospora sp. WMMD987]
MSFTSLSQHAAAYLVARLPMAPDPTPAGGGGINPTPNAPGQLTGLVNKLLGLIAWAGTAAGVAGVLITGTMMAISVKRGESSEHMSRLGLVLGGCILVAVAGPLANFFLGGAGTTAGQPQ